MFRRLAALASMMGAKDSSSSDSTKFCRGRGVKKAFGSGLPLAPFSGYLSDENSVSSSSSPNFSNWYR